MDLFILAVLATLVLLGMVAAQWGADSRPSFIDPRFSETNRTV